MPTRARAGYLDAALRSIAPQARAVEAAVLVVDDGGGEATRAVADRHGASYVAHDSPRGLNPAIVLLVPLTNVDTRHIGVQCTPSFRTAMAGHDE